MERARAAYLASRLVRILAPMCDRIEVAGSIRREKDDVKDVELVLIPKRSDTVEVVQEDLGGLFAGAPEPTQTVEGNILYSKWANTERAAFVLDWIKPGVTEVTPWHVKPDTKYWRGLLKPEWMAKYVFQEPVEGVQPFKLDIFLVQPDSWGIQFLIRTGPKDFSKAVMNHAAHVAGLPCWEGFLHRGHSEGPVVPTPEETDAFRLLGLRYVEPPQRIGPDSLVPMRATERVLARSEKPAGSLFG